MTAFARIGRSLGLVLIDSVYATSVHDWSFRVHPDGRLEELAGWGRRGRLPDLDYRNAPQTNNVHTVAIVDATTHEALTAVRELVDKHLEQTGECMVWVSVGSSRTLVNWASRGCPQPKLEEAPEEPEEQKPQESASEPASTSESQGEVGGQGKSEVKGQTETLTPEQRIARAKAARAKAAKKRKGTKPARPANG